MVAEEVQSMKNPFHVDLEVIEAVKYRCHLGWLVDCFLRHFETINILSSDFLIQHEMCTHELERGELRTERSALWPKAIDIGEVSRVEHELLEGIEVTASRTAKLVIVNISSKSL